MCCYLNTKKQYSIFTNEKDSSLKISVKIFRTPGNSPEKRLGLTKKDNCVKGLRLLCRSVFLLKLSGYMSE